MPADSPTAPATRDAVVHADRGARSELRARALGALLVLLAVFLVCGTSLVQRGSGTPVGEHYAAAVVAGFWALLVPAMLAFPVGCWLVVVGAGSIAGRVLRPLGMIVVSLALCVDVAFAYGKYTVLEAPAAAPVGHHHSAGEWD